MRAEPQGKAIAVLGVFQVAAVFFAIGAEIATRKMWKATLGDDVRLEFMPRATAFVHIHGRWLWIVPIAWAAIVLRVRQGGRVPEIVEFAALVSGCILAICLAILAAMVLLEPFGLSIYGRHGLSP